MDRIKLEITGVDYKSGNWSKWWVKGISWWLVFTQDYMPFSIHDLMNMLVRRKAMSDEWVGFFEQTSHAYFKFLNMTALCPSPTVPNLLPNEDECKKFESSTYFYWGEHESCKFFIWAWFFLDNSKIKIRHVWSQVDKVRLYLQLTMNEYAK